MSVLVEMAARYAARCDALVGCVMDRDTILRAQLIAIEYVDEVQKTWGVKLHPVVQVSEPLGTITFDPRPEVGSYDEVMWTALQRREGLLPAEEPKKSRKRTA